MLSIKLLVNRENWSLELSWVQTRRSSLSPPEITISLPPGLISLHSLHLALITSSAVPHFHCLYIPSSLTTLPDEFECIRLDHLCTVLYGSQVSVSLFSRTPAVVLSVVSRSVFCVVFCLLAFLFNKIGAYLHLDPSLSFLGAPRPYRDKNKHVTHHITKWQINRQT